VYLKRLQNQAEGEREREKIGEKEKK